MVGVADEVSPSGLIDVPLRELEARVVVEALADAGLSLRDVDGLCTCTGGTLMHSVELAEYLGHHTTIHRRYADRRRQLRAVRRARRRRDRGGSGRDCGHRVRVNAACCA